MKVLLTGHPRMVGQEVFPCLVNAGHTVIGSDIGAGQDLQDSEQLEQAMTGCDAVVHLAALDEAQQPFRARPSVHGLAVLCL